MCRNHRVWTVFSPIKLVGTENGVGTLFWIFGKINLFFYLKHRDEIIIDGEVATSYTFAQDYYWMMGDNRGNSQDSRSWGFVPFDHVLGKPVFVWFSWDTQATGFNKIRWNRLFTTVSGEGKPVSYFKYFLILLAGWFVFNHFRKKKKAAAK